ncbi:unnamed protein product [Rhizophagus irregularis]|nr:unnamed protein product [Rhizophagus irregularis]
MNANNKFSVKQDQNIKTHLLKTHSTIQPINKANTSELELLRQRIRELEAENAEMPDLRRKISEFDAEKTELKP